ncbi:MAG: DUF3048 domain-containing protein [Clostridia bacterium]|nr:DUF3048 domain-containing protein [Clostridia bacterium]
MKRLFCFLVALMIPVCGLAEHRPVLVSVGLASAQSKVNGRSVKAAGIGKRAPWGIHEADVIYEGLMFQNGQTRLGCVFQRSFPEAVGPVRSARIGQFFLREEWDAAFVYNGGAAWELMPEIKRGSSLFLDRQRNQELHQWVRREKGVKAPDNLSVDVAGVSSGLESGGNPVFQRGTPTFDGTEVNHISLDCGAREWSVQLHYDALSSEYMMNRNSAPFYSYPSAQERTAEQAVHLSFDSVIVQHSKYEWPSRMMPVLTGVGSGKADYFIDGVMIEGMWIKESVSSVTRYLDQHGNEMVFPDGRIYVAQFPADHQVTVNEGEILYLHFPQN